MSPQHDDDGTVIRPVPPGPGTPSAATSPELVDEAASAESDDGLSLRIGTRLAEFEITQRIGEGGFSIVYLAKDHSLERTVALKEYMPSSLATRVGSAQVQPRSQRCRDTFEAGLKSFVNEAKLLAQFDHPSLVKVYRFWEANGTAYMVMPFYRGVTVKDAIRAMPEPPDEAWLLDLLAPLTEALTVIHAEHCYHRDIAPDNVILLSGSAKPLLLDFGAARRVIGDMTQGLTVILKAGYAPVEQYAEVPGMKQGAWTDVYALGAVVYWAITGSTPPASVARIMSDSCVPLAACAAGRYSPAFLEAIDRALIVQPERRTQTIGDLRRDLGLTDHEGAPPLERDDPDATVIRPIGRRTGQTTHPQSRPGPHSVARSRSGGPTHAPSAMAPAPSLREPADEPVAPPLASPQPTTARQAAGDHESTNRRGRHTVLVAGALGTVVLASAIWWALQGPSAEPSGTTREGTVPDGTERPRGVTPSVLPSAVGTPIVETPARKAPMADPATPSMTMDSTPPDVPLPTRPESTPPAPPVKTAPIEPAPDRPPIEAPRKVAPAATRTVPRETNVDRPAPRSDPVGDRPSPDGANRAECARIMQRLSLGESSPDLIERLKTLKCR